LSAPCRAQAGCRPQTYCPIIPGILVFDADPIANWRRFSIVAPETLGYVIGPR
jgi:hypothetical protein